MADILCMPKREYLFMFKQDHLTTIQNVSAEPEIMPASSQLSAPAYAQPASPNKRHSTLYDLPVELLLIIMEQLDIPSRIRFRQICHRFYHLTDCGRLILWQEIKYILTDNHTLWHKCSEVLQVSPARLLYLLNSIFNNDHERIFYVLRDILHQTNLEELAKRFEQLTVKDTWASPHYTLNPSLSPLTMPPNSRFMQSLTLEEAKRFRGLCGLIFKRYAIKPAARAAGSEIVTLSNLPQDQNPQPIKVSLCRMNDKHFCTLVILVLIFPIFGAYEILYHWQDILKQAPWFALPIGLLLLFFCYNFYTNYRKNNNALSLQEYMRNVLARFSNQTRQPGERSPLLPQ